MRNKNVNIVFFTVAILHLFACCLGASDFASVLVSPEQPFGSGLYDDPEATLGKPSTLIRESASKTFACSLVYPAWNTAPDGSKVVVTLDIGYEVIVGFDHKVADDSGNPFGIDLIVFGNSKFSGAGWVDPDTDMNTYMLYNPTDVLGEDVIVSVAQYAEGPWYTFGSGPYADNTFPTNAFAWDSNSDSWADESDWLKPVNPNLGLSAFDGLSAAAAIKLYDGSAGGTGFDLQWLGSADYQALDVDPVSGSRWIQYVKVTSDEFGEVDGFSDVAGCGDYQHPFPLGDLNLDCKVDGKDLGILRGYWLDEISSADDPAEMADVYDDDVINFQDVSVIAENWKKCTWQCP